MLKAVKFRLYPKKEQKEKLEQHFGCARFIFNFMLDYASWQYEKNNTKTNRYDWQELLPKLKEYYPWLKDVNAQSLQVEIQNLDNAYKRFFKKLGKHPSFKSKYDKQSFSVPQSFKIKDNQLSIPKLKNIKIIITKDITDIHSITISKTKTGKYYASVLYDDSLTVPTLPVQEKDKALGIDLGLKHFATLSSGETMENPKFFRTSQKRLRRFQQALFRKKKNSSNRSKAKLKVALLHERISNKRSDFLHKITYALTCKNQEVTTICVESLNVKGMLKNRKLAKSISDVSWGEFLRQLKYKCSWNGLNLLECNRFDPSSKTCSNCGWINNDLKLSDRIFVCQACGMTEDRDLNASKNIIAFAFLNSTNDIYSYREDTRNFKPMERKALTSNSETVLNEVGSCIISK